VACLAEYPRLFSSPSGVAYNLNSFSALVISFFSLSLVENALTTGLIVYKILAVYHVGREGGVGYADAYVLDREIAPILSIMIESGVITFLAQLVQTVLYKFDITAYPIIGGLVVQLYVRSSTLSQLLIY
jgi:hypothetical protein